MMLKTTTSLAFAAACLTAIATMPAHAQLVGTDGSTPGDNGPQSYQSSISLNYVPQPNQGITGGAPRSLAATDDPVRVINDLGSRALAAMRNGDTEVARQERFRQLFRHYFDVEACAHSALGPHWLNATAL